MRICFDLSRENSIWCLLSFLTCMVGMGVLLAGCGDKRSSGPAPVKVLGDTEAKALLEKNCGSCHPVTRIDDYSDKTPWKEVVDRMIQKHGAKVAADDGAAIVDYLNRIHPLK